MSFTTHPFQKLILMQNGDAGNKNDFTVKKYVQYDVLFGQNNYCHISFVKKYKKKNKTKQKSKTL